MSNNPLNAAALRGAVDLSALAKPARPAAPPAGAPTGQGGVSYVVEVDEPLHNDVSEDTAYLVFPATLRSRLNGAEIVQTGAVFTIALPKGRGDDAEQHPTDTTSEPALHS